MFTTGAESVIVKCDVSKASEVEAMVAAVVNKFGRIDGAFNNAGVFVCVCACDVCGVWCVGCCGICVLCMSLALSSLFPHYCRYWRYYIEIAQLS